MFKLNFEIPPLQQPIGLEDRLLLLGSCFADEIGRLLGAHKFLVNSNPLGTLFNPLSIFEVMHLSMGTAQPRPLVPRGDLYYSWDTHSSWSGPDPNALKERMARQLEQTGQWLRHTDWVVLTLGTAYVYELNATGEVVANCHKFPQQDFTKRLLSVEEIMGAFERVHAALTTINPKVNFLFTVSPVRHTRDGLVENNLSKAILIQAVHQLVNSLPQNHYFPAYEIVMDELRDYRFFKEDMVHPSSQAIQYVWEAFQHSCLNESTRAFVHQWKSILAALRHRPMHPESTAHQKFLHATLSRLMELGNKVDITAELEQIKYQIVE